MSAMSSVAIRQASNPMNENFCPVLCTAEDSAVSNSGKVSESLP